MAKRQMAFRRTTHDIDENSRFIPVPYSPMRQIQPRSTSATGSKSLCDTKHMPHPIAMPSTRQECHWKTTSNLIRAPIILIEGSRWQSFQKRQLELPTHQRR